ncbi:DUF4189 domain-containing protein [Nocardia sp. IFM 10818]
MTIAAAAATLVMVGGSVAAAERGPDGKYYGSIAYADNGSWGVASNYPTQDLANRAAINKCGGTRNCSTKLEWTAGCAALTMGNDGPAFKGLGVGATPEEAEEKAFADLHRSTILPPVGSAAGMHDEGHLVTTQCNG